MESKKQVLVLLVMSVGFGLHSMAVAQQNTLRHRIGQIVEIHGKVYLKTSKDAKSIELHPTRDRKRALYAGDFVRCDAGAFLKVIVNRVEDTINPSEEWLELVSKLGNDMAPDTRAPSRRATGGSPSVAPASSDRIAAPDPARHIPTEPTAEEILARYAVVSGDTSRPEDRGFFGRRSGGSTRSGFSSSEARGVFETPFQSADAAIEFYTKGPDRTLAVFELPGSDEFKEGLNGISAWRQTPGFGVQDISLPQSWLLKFNPSSYASSRLRRNYFGWRVMNVAKLGAGHAWVLEGTQYGVGEPEKFYFDTSSALLVRVDSTFDAQGGHSIFERYLEDYRDVGGHQIPFSIRGVAPAGEFKFKLNEFKPNVPIADEKFAKPKSDKL